MSLYGKWLVRQRAEAPLDLDRDVGVRSQRQHLRQLRPRQRRRRRPRTAAAASRWSITICVFGLRAASCPACSCRPQHNKLTGSAWRAAEASTRLMPGSAGSVETLSRIMMRTPTVPFVAFQLAIVSATPGSFGSTGLTSPNLPGVRLVRPRWRSWGRSGTWKTARTSTAPSTRTSSIAATIWSPVTSAGPCRVPTQGRPEWLRS